MDKRSTFLRIFFILLIFGILNLLTILGRPIFTNVRAVDLLHLFGTGMCFGAAVVAFVAYFLGRRSS